jgi:maltooligosyltrehalose trehalohydrolase
LAGIVVINLQFCFQSRLPFRRPSPSRPASNILIDDGITFSRGERDRRDTNVKRRHSMPFGADLLPDRQVRFRLWGPAATQVNLCILDENEARYLSMPRITNGWFELITSHTAAGTRYRFQIDGRMEIPDPASRFQPDDVHGASEVVDPLSFAWHDETWRNRPWEEAVVYELHVGAFSPAGTFAGVEERLQHLVDLGVTAMELMPVADFPGRRNWGYDGVFPFAPDSRYGRPEDLKRLVQAAHRSGLMIMLDVVYNHFGPEGNYLREYAPQFFTDRYRTPWGAAINFDGPESQTVREFFIQNALYWLEEYNFDGLRLDAVHQIFDQSPRHFLNELAQTVRSTLGPDRLVHLVLENDNNEAHYLSRCPEQEPGSYTAQWNDDFHHSLHVALTGENDGYYSDYANQPAQRLARCLAEGFDYQGEPSPFRGNEKRGENSRDLPATAFVSFLQNHDQIGNRAFGERIGKLAETRALEAAMAIELLAPSPPLLFMGEEFGAETPFLFFCDFGPDLAQAVANGRREEFRKFMRFNDPAVRASIPDPNSEDTFLRSKLNWESLAQARSLRWLNFYRNLLNLRREYIVPLLPCLLTGKSNFRVLGERAIEVSWPREGGGALGMMANLGPEPVAGVVPAQGKTFFATPADSCNEHQLVPWSVKWFLKS